MPGALVRAQHGLLVADEFLEWSRDCRESLRGPLEDQRLTLHYSGSSLEIPLRIQFAGTSNLCPCGETRNLLDPSGVTAEGCCRCLPNSIRQYQGRLSGPILDRMDLRIYLGQERQTSIPAQVVEWKSTVEHARRRLIEKFSEVPGQWTAEQTENQIQIWPQESRQALDHSTTHPRSRHRIARIAVSLSALDGNTEVTVGQICEAQTLRG